MTNAYFQLEYDGKIQAYLKMTGLQASDLNKSKSKKKADTAKQNTHTAPPQNQMGMHAGQMMQHLGYAAAGNQATMMAPMGFPSSMASALPHFQQIWSAGQMYDQNQINQMQLMAAQAQQAQTTMMPGQQNGAAFFQQIQAAQQQQQQQQTQGQGQPQQVQAAQVQQQQQQPQDTTAVQIQQQVSPMYNGSPQMRSVASPQVNSTSPLNVTPQQPTQQPVVATAQEPQVQATFDQQISDSTATAVTNSSTTWSWHDPNAQGQQFDITGQNGPNTQDNGLIAAAAQQAFGESQQQDAATRRMSNEISQASVGTPQSSEDHKSGQPSPQGDAAQTPSAEVTNPTTQVQTSEHLVTQQQMNQSPQTTVDGQSQATSNPEQIGPQGQQIQSAHVVYNSYANYPWGNFPAQADGNQAQGQNGDGDNKVQPKETMLEAEVNHLRSALSEKTKEVQRLGQELEKAYQIIEQLKTGQVATGAVGSGGGGSM